MEHIGTLIFTLLALLPCPQLLGTGTTTATATASSSRGSGIGFGTFENNRDTRPVNASLLHTPRPMNTSLQETDSGQVLQMGVATCVTKECRPVLGSVINIFPRYGYNSLTMKVVPRNDSEAWLFSEPFKANIFDMSTIEVREKLVIGNARTNTTLAIATSSLGSNVTANVTVHEGIRDVLSAGTSTNESTTTTARGSSSGAYLLKDFHLQLCEDVPELLKAYFRSFRIEGFDRPWNVFGAGWRIPALVKFLGIEEPYTANDTEHFYLFARVSLHRRLGESILKPNFTIQPQFEHILQTLVVGNLSSSIKFFNDIGTHYLASYTTGNSLYQIFVYDRYGFEAIKAHLSETRTNASRTGGDGSKGPIDSTPPTPTVEDNYDGDFRDDPASNHFSGVLSYETLSALYFWVKNIGKIMVLNSSPQTVARIRNELHVRFRDTTNSSLFQLFDNETLLRQVESELIKEDAEGLLGLELKTIAPIFKNETQRKWFQESLASTMSLWENNL